MGGGRAKRGRKLAATRVERSAHRMGGKMVVVDGRGAKKRHADRSKYNPDGSRKDGPPREDATGGRSVVELIYLLGFVFFGVNFLLSQKYARHPGTPWRWRLGLAALACASAFGVVWCSLEYLGV